MKKNKITKTSGLGSGLSSLLGSEFEKKSILSENVTEKYNHNYLLSDPIYFEFYTLYPQYELILVREQKDLAKLELYQVLVSW